jgi:hypothetical protein
LSPSPLSAARAIFAFAGMATSEGQESAKDAKALLEDFLKWGGSWQKRWDSSFDSIRARGSGAAFRRYRGLVQTDEEETVEPNEYEIGLVLDFAYYLGSLAGDNACQPDLFTQLQLLAEIDRADLELEASAALASAEAILRSGAQLEDFSPLMICVAKAFESEINASLVQWYRERLGVEMPRYFKLHAPNVTALAGEGQPVDFNAKRRQDEWHPPSLGQSLWAGTRHFTEQPSELTPEQFAHLAEIWGHILPLRNRAAHSGSLDRSEFLFGAELWMKLKQERLLSKLLDLKLRLRLIH